MQKVKYQKVEAQKGMKEDEMVISSCWRICRIANFMFSK